MKINYLSAGLLVTAANAETIYEYMFVSKRYPPRLSMSAVIAEVEKERIAELAKEVDGVVCFLPTDDAWNEIPGAVEALVNEPEGNVRYDMLLAACAAIPTDRLTINELKDYARESGGVVDSAYGSSYTMLGDNQLCQYEWVGGDYKAAACAGVLDGGAVLEDGAIYLIDKLILPEDIEAALYGLIEAGRRRRR